MNPFSASVAYLTVLQLIVDSLSDTRSDAAGCAWEGPCDAQTAATMVTAKPARLHQEACINICVAFEWGADRIANIDWLGHPPRKLGILSQTAISGTSMPSAKPASAHRDLTEK
jgi:hypothetical protein